MHRDHEHFEEGEEKAPPMVRQMAVVRWALLVLVAMAAAFSIYTYAKPLLGQAVAPAGAKYICPMHPQIVSDRAGECPICHMDLVPAQTTAAVTASASASATAAPAAPSAAPIARGFTCPMHADVRTEGPGRCPHCGMDLVPVPEPKPRSAPPDTAPITLGLDRIQAIGVRTALVEKQQSGDGLRLTAAVEVPEQGRAEVHVRAAGYVEAIHVKDIGVQVRAGEPLVSVYSPEVLQAQQEIIAMSAWSTSGL